MALSSGDAWMGVGQPGASPNLGGIDIDDYDGSLPQGRRCPGVRRRLPHVRFRHPRDDHRSPRTGPAVIPWTVNTTDDMARLMNLGVDGIITDYPPVCAPSWRSAA